MAATPTAPTRRTARFDATISLGGRTFTVPLCTRPLGPGPAGDINYYWIDSSLFRLSRARRLRATDVFATITRHWWTAMELAGVAGEEDQIRTLVLAVSFPLVGGDRVQQHVYRDAHLGPKAVGPVDWSLDGETRARITAIVRARDREAVRAENLRLFGPPALWPPAEAAIDAAVSALLAEGSRLFRACGEDGLLEFLRRTDGWLAAVRRRGGQPYRRAVADYLSYVAKVAFYLCYTNLWVTLIPWLRANRGLDLVSERFLRVWHFQNQPVTLSDGRVVPDVFGGQVLALHPLSAYFHRDPALMATAGRFIATGAYDEALRQGRAAECPAYWDLVGAILSAAHLYRSAAGRLADGRGRRTRAGGEYLATTQDPAGPSAGTMFEELATNRAWACPACAGPLEHRGHDANADGTAATIEYACRDCERPDSHEASLDEIRSFLARDCD